MTKTLVLFLTLFLTQNLLAQNFEGQITYVNSFKSKVSNISDQQWTSILGSKQEYFIKGGNYRSNTNGTMVLWQLYINADNKLYNKLAGSDGLIWNDGATNQDEVLSTEVKQNAAEILGYKCDELILTCKTGVQKYYFAPVLSVESSLFTKHKYGNWAEYITRAKALPLKIIVDNGQFTMESLATAVKPMTLDGNLFVLPAGEKTAKSPY